MGSCYRYGGDEMMVLLPKHNLQQAAVVAEQICMSIAKLTFEKSSENITASIGLTSYPEVTKAVDDILLDAMQWCIKPKTMAETPCEVLWFRNETGFSTHDASGYRFTG